MQEVGWTENRQQSLQSTKSAVVDVEEEGWYKLGNRLKVTPNVSSPKVGCSRKRKEG